MIAGARPSAACHGECQERDTENEHFAHVCRHTGSNAIRQLVYRMVPAGDTGQKSSSGPMSWQATPRPKSTRRISPHARLLGFRTL
jgi:hypothetical protein